MSSSDDQSLNAQRQPQSRLKWFLVASVCLNLVMIGIIIGAGFSHHYAHPKYHYKKHFLQQLPDEKRKTVREIFKKHRTKRREHRKVIRQARQNVREILRSPDYSKDSFEKALTKLRELKFKLRKARDAMIIEVTSRLNLEERRAFKKTFRRGRRRHHR